MLARKGDRGDERFRHPLPRIVDAVDGIGNGTEESLRLPADQRRHQIVPPRIPPIRRHSRDASSAYHVFDRNALQPNGGGLGQGCVQDALAGSVDRLVGSSFGACATDHLDELQIHHDAATFGLTTPAARASAICRYRGAPNAHRTRCASSRSIGPISARVSIGGRS